MGHPDWNTSFPLPLGSDSERSARLWLAQAGNAQRQAFEQFIRQRFDEAHGARISSFMPDLFGLHELAAEDAHHAHQRPKVELYGDCLFVALKTAQMNEGKVEFGETHLFVGPRYLMTVRHGASLPHTLVRARCESNPRLLRKGPGFALYAILDFVVDNYFPILNSVEDAVEDLEERFFKGDFDQEDLSRLYQFKRDLVELRRAAAPLVEVST